MKNLYLILIAIILPVISVSAQNIKQLQPYGKADTADLRLADCPFEKGAAAMILFDRADVVTTVDSLTLFRHKRIKIFNDYGKQEANIRLNVVTYDRLESVPFLEAQTIRLEGSKIIFNKVEPNAIFHEKKDKWHETITFTFPEIKPGCIIEYRYKWKTISPVNFPDWNFQAHLPVRYSIISTEFANNLSYNIIKKGRQPFVLDTVENVKVTKTLTRKLHRWAQENVHSEVDEAFKDVTGNTRPKLVFQLHAIGSGYNNTNPADSWFKIANQAIAFEDFGEQLDVHLSKEDALLKQAEVLQTDGEKIAYLFNEVKKTLNWNGVENWYTDAGVHRAWNNKKGNTAEINLALYNLLVKAGIDAYPMLTSTRENNSISPLLAGMSYINSTVVYVPVDSARYYVLDASGKYNVYNEIPANLLNVYGLQINKTGGIADRCKIIHLANKEPALRTVQITAEINNDKLTGNVLTANYSYQRALSREVYDKMGEQKYCLALLADGDNAVKINNLKFENMEADSLPLIQKFNFSTPLTGADDQFIYFTTNMFSGLKINPFLNSQRYSDIDFGNCNAYNIVGKYKLPKGYVVDALPQGINMNMEDKSIIFRRRVQLTGDVLEFSYYIGSSRSVYSADEYEGLYKFYKRMFELLNEPVVLKKS